MYNVFLDRKFVALIYSGNAELKHKRGPELGYSVLSNQLIFQPILSNPLDFFYIHNHNNNTTTTFILFLYETVYSI